LSSKVKQAQTGAHELISQLHPKLSKADFLGQIELQDNAHGQLLFQFSSKASIQLARSPLLITLR
jgi:hypothetical protein